MMMNCDWTVVCSWSGPASSCSQRRPMLLSVLTVTRSFHPPVLTVGPIYSTCPATSPHSSTPATYRYIQTDNDIHSGTYRYIGVSLLYGSSNSPCSYCRLYCHSEFSPWLGRSCGTVCQRQFVTRTVYTLLNADSSRSFLACVLMIDSVMPFRSGFVYVGH